MATVYKNVSGVPASAGVTNYNTLYSTTASTTAVLSTIAVCNQGASTASFRIAIDDTGGTSAPSTAEFFVFDASAAANDTIFITIGATLANSRHLKFSASATTVSFTAFISEIS
jgi:hypothetical protein